MTATPAAVARREGDAIVLPGIGTAHSHAFQRALRGRTQRARGSFWSWRGLMYELASKVGPEEIGALSRFAFMELARSGVTAVGEFHYVHHQPDGTPYAARTALADAVVEAALDVGLRITLLRVIYQRGGFDGRPLDGAQRRFADPDVDDALRDAEALRARWAGEPRVEVGVAPHSLRACPIETFEAARDADPSWPVHAHVAEQRREVRECLAEHGRRPVALLEERGLLEPRFVAVHATHLDEAEVRALGGSFVCLCRTTERDLGDGLPPSGPLVRAGARLCLGVDSHALSDPFEEARAVELDERSRVEGRAVAVDATALLQAATAAGYAAIGMAGREAEDRVVLDATHPALVGADDATLDDAVVFGASAGCVREVRVAGETIVEEGRHRDEAAIRAGYLDALRRLGVA